MRSLPTVALLVTTMGVTACAADPGDADTPTGTAEYLASVEELLDPPSRLASITAERLAGAGEPAFDVSLLADAARRERGEFAELRLDSPVLARQRDEITSGYADLLAAMEPVVAAHRADDERALAAAARPFYAALRALPANVPPPDAP